MTDQIPASSLSPERQMRYASSRRAAPAAPRSGDQSAVLPVEFHGQTGEWFGIWIVNLLLSIVTLGIYSAWAKVRSKRYFYGNTLVDGHAFGYHAEPLQILKGRILVVVFIVAINLLANLAPEYAAIVTIIYLIVLPWAFVKGIAFAAQVTSWRNVRFGFIGRKRDALMTYIIWPFLGLLSAGLLWPFVSRSRMRFLAGRTEQRGHFFGQAAFSTDVAATPYYKGLLYAAGFIAAGIAAIIVGIGAMAVAAETAAETGAVAGIFLSGIAFYVFFILAAFVYTVVARNVNYGHLHLEGGHRFRSTIKVGRYTWIMVSNLVVSVLTLGLMVPWAQIRLARYLAENTFVLPGSDLDGFIAQAQPDGGVASGELLDMEGLDLGF